MRITIDLNRYTFDKAIELMNYLSRGLGYRVHHTSDGQMVAESTPRQEEVIDSYASKLIANYAMCLCSNITIQENLDYPYAEGDEKCQDILDQ